MRYPLLLALSAILILTACGTGGTPAAPSPSTPGPSTPAANDAAALRGPWRVVEQAPVPPVVGKAPTITFEEARLGARPGCNTMGGGYRVEGTRLVVERLISTKMACSQDLMDQEQLVAELLAAGPQWSVSGDRLTLSASDRRLVLVRNPGTPQPTQS
ncbi:META domain-containing protein [Naumannella sp. ID2617S]|nr:META domain-containing protein [Enemella dayhoffiae]NNG20088.1 META domain-containing protein [Naumannella sp. ID2617S]